MADEKEPREELDDETEALRVEPGVLAEARKLVKVLGLSGVTRVITRHGRCRVHVPKDEDEPAKTCAVCRINLTLDSYNKNRITTDGLQRVCRQCDYTAMRIKVGDTKRKLRDRLDREAEKFKRQMRDEAKGGAGLVTREKWPGEPKERLRQLKNVLPKAIRDYDGQEAQMSVALNIPMDEIRKAIDGDKELSLSLRHAQLVAVAKVEANAYRLARDSNNVAAVKLWLTNKTDNWHDKSSVEMRNVGFGAVQENEEDLKPILKIVNRNPED